MALIHNHSSEWFFIAQSRAIPALRLLIIMLGFDCGESTADRRLNMPVQRVELEEVQMMEFGDDVLEAAVEEAFTAGWWSAPRC